MTLAVAEHEMKVPILIEQSAPAERSDARLA
jgi:hypothetical protein